MYHYIWPDTEEVPAGIRPLLASEFIEQLDELEGRYDIVGPERFLERLDETSDRPPCLLTFDDGTRDHAHVATPILANREMAGVFFIISDAARGKLMPTTHLTHWLLGRDDEDVWKALGAYAAKDPAMLGDAGEAKRIYHYETQTRARIKYALNMAMSPKRSRQFALSMLERVGMSEKQLARDWFASVADLEAMHRSGMTLALHGKTHRDRGGDRRLLRVPPRDHRTAAHVVGVSVRRHGRTGRRSRDDAECIEKGRRSRRGEHGRFERAGEV
jgi:peptidoglycan/xylan/chitin deacetylase (PgdA/CDA1 family)